jgi:hypothetical protein
MGRAARLSSEDAHSENEDVPEAVETSPPARGLRIGRQNISCYNFKVSVGR